MKIKLLEDIPVQAKHNMTSGRILEVLRPATRKKKNRQTQYEIEVPDGYWVQGNGEEVKIFERECKIIES